MRVWEKAKALLRFGRIEEDPKRKYWKANLKAIGMRLGEIYFIICLIGSGFAILCLAIAAYAAKPCLWGLGTFSLVILPATIYFGVRFAARLDEIASHLRSKADDMRRPFSRW